MLAWAVVWKAKRRRETKQKHWPTKKRKQERKRTKHPVHSSQSVGEGGSMSSAFLCWSGHRQRWPSLRYSNLPFFRLYAQPTMWYLLFYPWISQIKGVFNTFPPLWMLFREDWEQCGICRLYHSSGGMSVREPWSPLGIHRQKLTLLYSKRSASTKPRVVSCSQENIHPELELVRAQVEKIWFLCENISCSSSQQLTWEWNQRGDLVVVSAQEGASSQGGVSGMGRGGRLQPVLFILGWGCSMMLIQHLSGDLKNRYHQQFWLGKASPLRDPLLSSVKQQSSAPILVIVCVVLLKWIWFPPKLINVTFLISSRVTASSSKQAACTNLSLGCWS